MEFAVHYEGLTEGQGRWVLHVDPAGERLLIADEDGTLHWQAIAESKLIRVHTPDIPVLVMPVQPQQQPGVLVPGTFNNRAMRRNGHDGT